METKRGTDTKVQPLVCSCWLNSCVATVTCCEVIAAVEGATGGASAAAKQKGTKRAAVEDVKQPKLSKFFGKK